MKIKIVPVAAGLAAAAGIAITGASLASADQVTSSASAAAYSQSAPQGETGTAPDPSKPMRSDEQLLTGDVAAKVTAAAKAKEPTATIERVETDSDGVYEAHMVRTDGTHIIVQIDKSYAVTAVQEGGHGGPGGAGGPVVERRRPSRASPRWPRPAPPPDGRPPDGRPPDGRPPDGPPTPVQPPHRAGRHRGEVEHVASTWRARAIPRVASVLDGTGDNAGAEVMGGAQ